MIKSITLKGFQRHRKLLLELDPGVTTIVGPTDSGKSAILRGIRWVCLNKAPRSSLIHEDVDKASVTLTTDDHKIVRVKSTTSNIYKVDGKRLAAFGRDVPAEVANVLRLSPLNFQGQHDRSLWFGESAPEVSRQLNDIVDLGVIDTTLSNLTSKLRKAKVEEEVLTKQYEEAVQTKRKLRFAKRAASDLKALEVLARDTADKAARIVLLDSLVTLVSTYRAQAKRLRRRLREGTGDLVPVEQVATRIDRVRKQITRIGDLLEEARKARMDAKYHKGVLKEAEASLKSEMGIICVLCGSEIPS